MKVHVLEKPKKEFGIGSLFIGENTKNLYIVVKGRGKAPFEVINLTKNLVHPVEYDCLEYIYESFHINKYYEISNISLYEC